jgi:hypothetical protein
LKTHRDGYKPSALPLMLPRLNSLLADVFHDIWPSCLFGTQCISRTGNHEHNQEIRVLAASSPPLPIFFYDNHGRGVGIWLIPLRAYLLPMTIYCETLSMLDQRDPTPT